LRLEVLLFWACKPPELFGQGRLNSERPVIDGKLAHVACLTGQCGLKHSPFRSHLATKSGRGFEIWRRAAPGGLPVRACKLTELFGQGRLNSEQPLIDGKLAAMVHLMRQCELKHGRFSDLFAIQPGH
jgi:hypothetical protein